MVVCEESGKGKEGGRSRRKKNVAVQVTGRCVCGGG